MKRVVIVGGGPVGLMAAYTFALHNTPTNMPVYEIDVFERRPDPRIAAATRDSWSFNILMGTRAIGALREAGIFDQILAKGKSTNETLMCMGGDNVQNGSLTGHSTDFGANESYVSINRDQLMEGLLEALDGLKVGGRVKVHFEATVKEFKFEERTVVVRRGEESQEIGYDFLLGADGARSKLRLAMTKVNPNIIAKESAVGSDVKAFKVPFSAIQEQGLWPPSKASKEQSPPCLFFFAADHSSAVVACPNKDSYTMALNMYPPISWDAFKTLEEERIFLEKRFPMFGGLMAKYSEPLFGETPYRIIAVDVSQFNLDGYPVLLIGDAAHAIPPTYGQGLNSAFEDVTILNQLLTAHNHTSFDVVARIFSTQRKPSTDAISVMSWDMARLYQSDLVAMAWMVLSLSRDAVVTRLPAPLRKRLWHEHSTARLVAFSNVDYKVIKALQERQRLTDPIVVTALVLGIGYFAVKSLLALVTSRNSLSSY